MPIEFRFDDLDLQEEPEVGSGKSTDVDGSIVESNCCTTTNNCTTTLYC